MNKIVEGYFKLLKVLIALCLAVMVVLVFGNVVLRYGFNSGITVSEELSRWLFVWLTFLGAIVALREHGHLGVDMLVSRLPPIGKKVCLIVSQLLMLYVTWLLLDGQLGADHDQSRRRRAPATGSRWGCSTASASSSASRLGIDPACTISTASPPARCPRTSWSWSRNPKEESRSCSTMMRSTTASRKPLTATAAKR